MKQDFVYAREDRSPYIAYSQAMGRDIPQHYYFTDRAGEKLQLYALLKTANPGDTIIVGTITDFMFSDVNAMLDLLEDFAENDIRIESRLEPDYTIEKYRPFIRLLDTYYRVMMGEKPI